jgi:hypothetical protein
MNSSYGHAIVRLTEFEEEQFNRVRGGGPGQVEEYTLHCSGHSRKYPCNERVKWRATYRYITGRQGRTSTAVRHYCDRHAVRFCGVAGIRIPESLGTGSGTGREAGLDAPINPQV